VSRPYFSAVLDNYNYGRFIGQAIDSVLAQDFPQKEIEIVVVDDGSTDDSVAVVERYKDRVKLIRQANSGQAACMNTGLMASTGQVACLLDSDDYWHPAKLTRVADALKDPSIGVVQHYQREVDREGRELPHALPTWKPVFTLKDLLTERFDYGATSSLALRREVLDKILPMPRDLFYFTDVYLVDYGLLHTNMRNLAEVLGYHRLHGANNWAKTYLDPKKLAGSVREGRVYRSHLEPLLKERGLPWTHQCFALQPHEIARREALLASHEGRRLDLLTMMPRVWRASGGGRFAAFRCATLMLALISPAVYLKFYDLYNENPALAKLRGAVTR
jgi:glycosyltransferase involved in cell wall biosynthesis